VRSQELDCSSHILLFASPVLIPSLAHPYAAEVEAQGAVALALISPNDRFHDPVLHVTAIEGMRMGDHDPGGPADKVKERLELQAAAGNEASAFRHIGFPLHLG
jgi:hypothetical protein